MWRIGNIELKCPIIQGGMGVGVSLGRLAGAVAKQGGVGVISTVNAGYREPDFEKNAKEANLRALENEIDYAIKEADGNGLVAINIMVAVNNYEETVATAIKSGVQAIISGAGVPMNLPELVKDTDVLIAPIVSSRKSARVILKSWDKKYGVVPDFIIIEGPKAGGHLGFRKEDLMSGNVQAVDEILTDVLDELKEYEEKYDKTVPVFVAGGVYDGHDMAKMVNKGATGVQIATRFIATRECDAAEQYKEMMVNAREEDILLVPSPVGLPGRALNTPLIQNVLNGGKFLAQKCNLCLKACTHDASIPYCISRALIEAVKGNIEDGLFFCGANVHRIDKIMSVEELMSGIMKEFLEDVKNLNIEYPRIFKKVQLQ